jgi:glucarate dehydratase
MKIIDLKATTVTVPLEASLRHANGAHWGRFVRTIVEVHTDNGLIGLGEMGGGASAEEAIRVDQAIEDLRNDYFEDPTFGLEGMRRVRHFVRIPTATNTVVISFEQLASCIRTEAVDVILLDTTFWGGLRQAYKAGQVLEVFQWGASVHSSGELGIQLATMLHLGAALPNLGFAADAHYHHLMDDIIKGGKLPYRHGKIRLPEGPGLGVELDRERLERYAELYQELGGYRYDRDPERPNWVCITPERNYADPSQEP